MPGRRVVPLLMAAGHAVTGVARGPHRAGRLRSQGARPVAVDLFDARAVVGAVDGHDTVLNLATAIPPTSRMWWRRAWRTNDRLRTVAAGHLVDAAIEVGAARVVQEPFAPAYPDRGRAWIDERTPLHPPAQRGERCDGRGARRTVHPQPHRRRHQRRQRCGVVLRFGQFIAADAVHTRDVVRALRRGVMAVPEPADGHRLAAHGPLRAGRRSLRVSNRRLREVTGWAPVVLRRPDGAPDSVWALGTVGGRVTTIDVVRDPDKLTAL